MKSLPITTETVAIGEMPVYVARPKHAPARAGILVFQEAFGVNAHIRDVTERFARAGYVAAAPALFHRTDAKFEAGYTDFGPVMEHMQALTTDGLIDDIRATYEWITSPTGGKAEVVGTSGYCLGGRTSFLAAGSVPVKAAVSYYGGGIAPSERGPGLMEYIPAVQAPLLFFWGGLDSHIPPSQIRPVEDALKEAGKAYINVVISDADHGFFCDDRASYNATASQHAWDLALSFLRTHLG